MIFDAIEDYAVCARIIQVFWKKLIVAEKDNFFYKMYNCYNQLISIVINSDYMVVLVVSFPVSKAYFVFISSPRTNLFICFHVC